MLQLVVQILLFYATIWILPRYVPKDQVFGPLVVIVVAIGVWILYAFQLLAWCAATGEDTNPGGFLFFGFVAAFFGAMKVPVSDKDKTEDKLE